MNKRLVFDGDSFEDYISGILTRKDLNVVVLNKPNDTWVRQCCIFYPQITLIARIF